MDEIRSLGRGVRLEREMMKVTVPVVGGDGGRVDERMKALKWEG
jgi:hypothetical protein